jgi:glutaminyl-peptide cyclotransferase
MRNEKCKMRAPRGIARGAALWFSFCIVNVAFCISLTAQAGKPAVSRVSQSKAEPAAGQFSGERAMQYTREIVAMGPRMVGSSGHRKLEAYLRAHLAKDQIEEDSFSASTPAGTFAMKNIIAKFPGTKDGIIVVGSHYDTCYPLKNFVGANDGGSTTGLLLELANHLRGAKREGYTVWLVWFDGEEAIQQWTADDSLYGSKHLAAKWKADGTAAKIKAFLLADMIGDRDLDIQRDTNSTPWLLDVVGQAAAKLNYGSHFFEQQIAVEDDHLPFARIGVPVADIIDLNYGYNNVFHHTPEDTIDKVSAKSLGISGSVILETIRMLDNR